MDTDSFAIKYLCDEISENYHLKGLLYDQCEPYERQSLINLHASSFTKSLDRFVD